MLLLKKYSFLLLLIGVSCTSIGQKKEILRLDINTNAQTKVNTFYTHQSNKRFDNTTTIYWTIKREIHSSQGDYSGKLLHGSYTEYFANNQLQTKGQLKLGIRVKEWKFWYENGILQKTVTYKNGKIHGKVVQYNEKGKVMRIEKYKKGLKHGTFTKIINDTLTFTEKYKNGFLKVSKKRVFKPSFKIKNGSKKKDKKSNSKATEEKVKKRKKEKPVKDEKKNKMKINLPKFKFKKEKNESIQD